MNSPSATVVGPNGLGSAVGRDEDSAASTDGASLDLIAGCDGPRGEIVELSVVPKHHRKGRVRTVVNQITICQPRSDMRCAKHKNSIWSDVA